MQTHPKIKTGTTPIPQSKPSMSVHYKYLQATNSLASPLLHSACRLLSLVQNSISHSQGSRRVFRDSILLNYSRQIRYQRKQSFDIWPRLRGWQGTKRNNIRPTAAVESDTCTKYLVGQLVRLEPFTFFAHFHSRWRDRACCATRALRSSFT